MGLAGDAVLHLNYCGIRACYALWFFKAGKGSFSH